MNTALDIKQIDKIINQWLSSVSATILESDINYIRAKHVVTFPENKWTRVSWRHIDPSKWEKIIEFSYFEEKGNNIINIKLSSNKIYENILIQKWWLLLVYDFKKLIKSNTVLPKYSIDNIEKMKREMLLSSIFLLTSILVELVLGVVFVVLSSPVSITLIGLIFLYQSISLSLSFYNIYENLVEKIVQISLEYVN